MGLQRQSGPLTPEQLAELAEAALSNAADLLAEARLLAEHQAWARCYSLAILAGEEFGKAQMAIGTVGRHKEDDDYWRDWWKDFYGHSPKLARAANHAAAVIPEAIVQDFIRLLEPALQTQRREAGLYVDLVTGAVVRPESTITPVEAQTAIQIFGEVIDGFVAHFATTGLAETFLAAHRGPGAEMRKALDSRDRDRIRATWEATTGRQPSEAELDHILAPEA